MSNIWVYVSLCAYMCVSLIWFYVAKLLVPQFTNSFIFIGSIKHQHIKAGHCFKERLDSALTFCEIARSWIVEWNATTYAAASAYQYTRRYALLEILIPLLCHVPSYAIAPFGKLIICCLIAHGYYLSQWWRFTNVNPKERIYTTFWWQYKGFHPTEYKLTAVCKNELRILINCGRIHSWHLLTILTHMEYDTRVSLLGGQC